jgi:Acyl-CoA oxidase
MQELGQMGKTPYEILMRETSDTVQDLAMAYGERHMIEQCLAFLPRVKNAANKKLMELVFRIQAIDTINHDASFYLLKGAISVPASKAMNETYKKLIKEAAQHVSVLLEILNVPAHALHAPIAADYVDYYSRPNYGEAYVAKL